MNYVNFYFLEIEDDEDEEGDDEKEAGENEKE